MSAKKILLYDDHDTLRESLQELLALNEGFRVYPLSEAIHIEDDLVTIEPHVILMDIDMPNVNGVDAVIRIRKIDPSIPIIMLTIFEENEYIFKSICAGANGYILKRFITTELIPAIESVLCGGAPMTGLIARKVLKILSNQSKVTPTITLLDKEKEILQQLVNGNSYKMIAHNLGITIDSVRFNIKKIYEKLHVHSAVEAVTKAINEKLL
jgi:DNA-binding NarL/FixJ family response regulator